MIVRPEPEHESGGVDPRKREPAGASVPEGPAPATATISSHRHPTLGLPPVDMTAGFPVVGDRVRLQAGRIAARALEASFEFDPTIPDRYDELGMRRLLNDAQLMVERLSRSIASGDPRWLREWSEMSAPVYRRRGVPMADLMAIAEGIRETVAPTLTEEERAPLDSAIDAAEAVYEWHGQLAGDMRRRNGLLRFLYRGA